MDLLDVNVLVALAVEEHIHHQRAMEYWNNEAAEIIAISRVSMLGFLRILGNPAAMAGQPLSLQDAWRIYLNVNGDPSFRFVSEPEHIEVVLERFVETQSFTSRSWTDAYLAAFAIAGGQRLVSFDSDFSRFTGLDFLHLRA